MPVLPVTNVERMKDGLLAQDGSQTRVETIINAVSMAIQKYLSRSLRREEFSETFHVNELQQIFSVFHSPIVELGDVTNLEQVLAAENIKFRDHMVIIDTYVPIWGANGLVIEGVGGMAETTEEFIAEYPDIVMEAELWIAARYKRQLNPEIRSLSSAGASTTYTANTMPASLEDVLNMWKRKSI